MSPFPSNLVHYHLETLIIRNEVLLSGPVVVAEYLLIKVTKQMERFDANVGAFQAALEKRPKVLKAVRVYLPIYISVRVVDDLVSVVRSKPEVSTPFISGQLRAGFDVLTDHSLHICALTVRDNFSADLAATLKDSDNDCLSTWATLHNFRPLALVHEPGLTADERFIHFDVPGQFSLKASGLHCFANAMHHEPCRLLGNSDGPVNLIRRNSVLCRRNDPNRSKPLVQAQRRVLKNRARLCGELPFRMMAPTLPLVLIFEERHVSATTDGTDNTIRPEMLDHVIQAVVLVSKIQDRFLKCLRFLNSVFHESRVPGLCGFVTYVNAISK